MFPFMLIALFFATLSLFLGVVAPCTRIGSYLSGLLGSIAWVFQVITTTLMTWVLLTLAKICAVLIRYSACFVQGRHHFNSNGQSAKLGPKAFGFMWTALTLLTLSSVLYCMGGAAGRSSSSGYTGRETRRRGFFASRRSSTKSHGSTRSKREDEV